MIRPETKKHKLGNHVFITAEIGTNHTGSINIAKKIISFISNEYSKKISLVSANVR